jgi:hypothetical protein
MALPSDFLQQLQFVPLKEIAELFQRSNRPTLATRWVLKNEIRPVDLYCYFGARFGQPNGIQNILRGDHSDNLIHWEWFLRWGEGYLTIQGTNFRTEVWLSSTSVTETDRDSFIEQLKADFPNHAKGMGQVRKALEHWIEFVNPYRRLRRSVESLMTELTSLGLDTSRDSLPDFADQADPMASQDIWKNQADKYSRAIGLSFGIRSMLPVMGEAFVNLMMYVLLKPDLRKDERLRDNAIRQPIDIRVRSLSHNCRGFKVSPDYSSEACKQYHSLVNERNDLLHGNIVVDKLKFNELYFFGRVPVFIRYSSMWERSLGDSHRAVGMEKVAGEIKVIDDLVEYLLSCLEDNFQKEFRVLATKFSLGLCLDDGRLGILFSDHLADFAIPRGPAPAAPA